MAEQQLEVTQGSVGSVPTGVILQPSPDIPSHATALDVGGTTALQVAVPTSAAAPSTGTQAAQPTSGQAVPSDWREVMAKGDAKMLERLKRYTSPDAVGAALIQLQNKISAGELRSALPKNATEEQIKAWRTENGLPEKPDDYDLKFDDGLVVDKKEMPNLQAFLEMAHKNNFNNAQVKEAIRWHFDFIDVLNEQRANQDKAVTMDAAVKLRTQWGNDYETNMNMIQELLASVPESVRENLQRGRLADQTPLFSSPEVLNWLAGLQRELNPQGTNVGQGVQSTIGNVDARIAEINEIMRKDRQRYNRDTAMQQELYQLNARKIELTQRAEKWK